MLAKANKQCRKRTKNGVLRRLIKQILKNLAGIRHSKQWLARNTWVMIAIDCLLPSEFFALTDAMKEEHSL
jgi:hypothetical protein